MIEIVDDLLRWAEHLHGTKRVSTVVWTIRSPVVGGSAWTFGAWVEVAAAASLAAHVLDYLYLQDATGVAPQHYQLEVGVGAAGSEVVIGRLGLSDISTVGDMQGKHLEPAFYIPADARVAVRAAGDKTTGSVDSLYGFLPREY